VTSQSGALFKRHVDPTKPGGAASALRADLRDGIVLRRGRRIRYDTNAARARAVATAAVSAVMS
jgi:hypothetical protein